MARVTRGTVSKRKHKKVLALTKGFRGTKSKLIKVAKEASLHAGQYAYNGRRLKKRDFRTLWINRVSEAVKNEDISYSVFIGKLKKANISLDRKILSQLITDDINTFKYIVDKVKNI